MASLMKWTPSSVTVVKGHPNLVNMHSYKFFIVTTTILVLNVFASTNLVA